MGNERKACTKCKSDKPFAAFSKHKLGRFGLRSECRQCTAEYGAAYHAANRQRLNGKAIVKWHTVYSRNDDRKADARRRASDWYAGNRVRLISKRAERSAEIGRSKAAPLGKKRCGVCLLALPTVRFAKDVSKPDGLRTTCRECKSTTDKAYFAANADRLKDVFREYYLANKQKWLTYASAQRGKPSSKRKLEYSLQWRLLHPGRSRALCARWAKNNPERRAINQQRRRVIRNSSDDGTVTWSAWKRKLAAVERQCYYCKKKTSPLVLEHMTPLCRGGKHSIDNVIPACRRCNSRKGKLTAEEFLAKLAKKRDA